MIPNLEKRQWLWGHRGMRGPQSGHDLYDSLPYPFEDAGLQHLFDGKDVLEIGPGNGRQYERVRGHTKSYCIADISPSALAEPVFDGVHHKFLLEDWGTLLNRSFDIVHFWYVLHHICHDEMEQFFAFIHNHLRFGGFVTFNCPQPINVKGSEFSENWTDGGDGLGTTYSDPHVVRKFSPMFNMLVALHLDKKSTGYVFLLQTALGDMK